MLRGGKAMTEGPASFDERDGADRGAQQSEHAGASGADGPGAGRSDVGEALQDLLDLPRQLLPPDTYKHLQSACRETALTAYSLWRHWNKLLGSNSGQRPRRHIDVE
jgi:hypothetical protein